MTSSIAWTIPISGHQPLEHSNYTFFLGHTGCFAMSSIGRVRQLWCWGVFELQRLFSHQHLQDVLHLKLPGIT